jgi:hypothetical protein
VYINLDKPAKKIADLRNSKILSILPVDSLRKHS